MARTFVSCQRASGPATEDDCRIVAYEIKQEPSGDDARGPAGQNELAEIWKQAEDAAKRLEAELATERAQLAAERSRSAHLREENIALRGESASYATKRYAAKRLEAELATERAQLAAERSRSAHLREEIVALRGESASYAKQVEMLTAEKTLLLGSASKSQREADFQVEIGSVSPPHPPSLRPRIPDFSTIPPCRAHT